jgi:phosphatidylglycerol:prolipoprotein diacylglycerol transferase
MHPILVKLGPVAIHTYGFMMALGVAFGLWFLYVQAKKQKLDAPRLLDAAFYILIVSIIGAKLVLLVGNFGYYTSSPRELFSLARSGGVFQGGLAFGVIFGFWYFWRHKIPAWKVADIIGPALALGHGFGRIGCFMAGCCYGSACKLPWGVIFTSSYSHELTGVPLGVERHPVQLYESALNFLNFLVLFLILRKKKFDGQVMSFYIMNYSVIRFFTEYFRGDHPADKYLLRGATPLASLSYPQVFCIVGLVAGLGLFLILKSRKRNVA